MKLEIKGKPKALPPQHKFIGRFSIDGSGLSFSDYTKTHLRKYIKENPNTPFELKPLLPESANQRRFFEGAIVPLVTFYQDGMDYRNSLDREKVRMWLKTELNGSQIAIQGKVHRIAQSTKNKLSTGFVERCVTWVIENYNPPDEALDPKAYKHWHDSIFMNGGAETYIDYLLELNLIKK